MVRVYNGILLGHEKNKILQFAKAWLDLEGIMSSKISQTKKEKYHILSFIRGI